MVLYGIKGNEKFCKHPGFEKVRSYSARIRKFLTKKHFALVLERAENLKFRKKEKKKPEITLSLGVCARNLKTILLSLWGYEVR